MNRDCCLHTNNWHAQNRWSRQPKPHDIRQKLTQQFEDAEGDSCGAVAQWLKIPIIVTAEEIEADGHTTSGIREVLPIGTTEFDKWTFGLAAQADILSAVQATEKRTAVLAGLETDVCVQHSAFGLIALGYKVAVVVDATATKGHGYEIGLRRMAGAGVARVSCKSLLFEWLRHLDSTHDFFRNSGIKAPEGLDLSSRPIVSGC